ncbi:hypothetical protein [Mycobacterium uberis]|uniref:hypothetical protein n=1 Tax=Mycobacterium uberis TaxID=2162698 RepID=UPI000E30B3EA|nr:hypothetical protein [Mycobacterium uberis]
MDNKLPTVTATLMTGPVFAMPEELAMVQVAARPGILRSQRVPGHVVFYIILYCLEVWATR